LTQYVSKLLTAEEQSQPLQAKVFPSLVWSDADTHAPLASVVHSDQVTLPAQGAFAPHVAVPPPVGVQ
jgi:hypothetical protein